MPLIHSNDTKEDSWVFLLSAMWRTIFVESWHAHIAFHFMASTFEQIKKEMSEFNACTWLVHKAETKEHSEIYTTV